MMPSAMLIQILCFLLLNRPTHSAPVAIGQRDDDCPPYVVVETRGTSVPQGDDPSFTNTLNTLSNKYVSGTVIDTVYPAAANQDYLPGTEDILANVKNSTQTCPQTKIVLAGMSQGASATTVAIQRIDLSSVQGNSIAAVLLLGNPMHRAGKLSNVDAHGGKSTASVNGIYGVYAQGIPTDWDRSGKVMDLCRLNDTVCTGVSPYGNIEHLLYGYDPDVTTTASNFLLKRLRS